MILTWIEHCIPSEFIGTIHNEMKGQCTSAGQNWSSTQWLQLIEKHPFCWYAIKYASDIVSFIKTGTWNKHCCTSKHVAKAWSQSYDRWWYTVSSSRTVRSAEWNNCVWENSNCTKSREGASHLFDDGERNISAGGYMLLVHITFMLIRRWAEFHHCNRTSAIGFGELYWHNFEHNRYLLA